MTRVMCLLALLGGVAEAKPVGHAPIRPLATRQVGPWHAQLADNGVPAWLYGSHVDAPGAVRDPAAAERAARAFLAGHRELLAPGEGDFQVIANVLDGDKRTVGMQQMWRGLPVVGGELGFHFAHDRLVAVASRAVPNVHATGRGHAVLRDRLVEIEDRGEWTVYVDGETRAELDRRRNIADATSSLHYNVGVRYAQGARMNYLAPDAFITVNGAAQTTGSDGSFSWAGGAPATVAPGLTGTYVQIINAAGTLATAMLTAQDGMPTGWSLAGDEFGDAQLSTFVYASIAKAKARVINPAIATWLDQQLPFYVNESGACNAYTTPTDLHFFQASSDCQNTGRLADIVFHEFGHALHYHSIVAGMGVFDLPMSEGLADFNAANLTEDPGVGRGLYFSDAAARDIDPYGLDWKHPDDDNFDPHVTGEIISGALWDLRKTLVTELGHDPGVAQTQVIFAGVLKWSAGIPQSFVPALLADDDDGDLANGTPHYCAIQRAFGAHGIADDTYQPTVVAPPVIDGTSISVTVTTPAQVGPCQVASVTAMQVVWQPGSAVGGTFPLVASGDTWTGAFPDQPPGTVITYTVDATLDDGSHVVLPQNPADPLYQVFVGPARQIWCEDFEKNPMWAQTGDAWQWGAPFSPPTSHDPPTCHGGSGCWGTKLFSTGLYDPSTNTTTTSPAIDVSAYPIVHLVYWRWLSVEDATYDTASLSVNGHPVFANPASKPGTLDFVDKEWRLHDVDVSALVAEDGTISVQWGLVADDSNQFGGWTLDDVCLVGLDKLSVCGDNVLDDGEQCDDGNTNDGDGCSAKCRNEITAGGGGGCAAGGEPSLIVLGALYFFVSRSRRRTARSSSGRLSART